MASPSLDAQQRRDQSVDILGGIVKRQRRADGRFHAEAAQNGLGAVVAGAHGDTLLVEGNAHILGSNLVEAVIETVQARRPPGQEGGQPVCESSGTSR